MIKLEHIKSLFFDACTGEHRFEVVWSNGEHHYQIVKFPCGPHEVAMALADLASYVHNYHYELQREAQCQTKQTT